MQATGSSLHECLAAKDRFVQNHGVNGPARLVMDHWTTVNLAAAKRKTVTAWDKNILRGALVTGHEIYTNTLIFGHFKREQCLHNYELINKLWKMISILGAIVALPLVLYFAYVFWPASGGLDYESVFKLTMWYKAWVIDGKPENFEVHQYYKGDDMISLAKDTNHYVMDNKIVTALVRSEFSLEGKGSVFILTRDGTIFRQNGTVISRPQNGK